MRHRAGSLVVLGRPVSQAERMDGHEIRRFSGEMARPLTHARDTLPQGNHRSSNCKNGLQGNRALHPATGPVPVVRGFATALDTQETLENITRFAKIVA